MTIQQVLDTAKNFHNALSSDYWSDSELLFYLYLSELELARKARTITGNTVISGGSVAGTSDYTRPTNVWQIWRIEYDGQKLQSINRRELDSVSGYQPSVQGTPLYYLYYGSTITLYPTPSTSAAVIRVYSHNVPTLQTSAAATIDTPAEYHDALVKGVKYFMAQKDAGSPLLVPMAAEWAAAVTQIEDLVRIRDRGDRFGLVVSEEDVISSTLGII